MLNHTLYYRDYEIYYDREPTPLKRDWVFHHKDHDGDPEQEDLRRGREQTIEHCLLRIDELIENEEED